MQLETTLSFKKRRKKRKKKKNKKRRDFAITKYTLFHTKNLSQEVMTSLVILWLLAIYPLGETQRFKDIQSS